MCKHSDAVELIRRGPTVCLHNEVVEAASVVQEQVQKLHKITPE